MAENSYPVQLPERSTERERLALRSWSVPIQSMEQDKLLQKQPKT